MAYCCLSAVAAVAAFLVAPFFDPGAAPEKSAKTTLSTWVLCKFGRIDGGCHEDVCSVLKKRLSDEDRGACRV
jgi:hypothetical protein